MTVSNAVSYTHLAVSGRSMENALKVSTQLGYMNVPEGTVVPLEQIKSCLLYTSIR